MFHYTTQKTNTRVGPILKGEAERNKGRGRGKRRREEKEEEEEEAQEKKNQQQESKTPNTTKKQKVNKGYKNKEYTTRLGEREIDRTRTYQTSREEKRK